MNLKHLPLAKQISLASAALVFVIVLALTLATAWFTSQRAISNTKANISSQAKGLADLLDISYNLSEDSTGKLSELFESWFTGQLQVDPGKTVQVGSVQAPTVYLNGQEITGNFNLVDQFSKVTGGGVATVFAKVGDDFVRVSTSLKKENGERAVGTFLGKKHPGYQSFLDGKPYLGEATLFGKKYMTKYVPIKSASGNYDLILFVGFDITNVIGKLQNSILNTHIGQTGVPYVIRTAPLNLGEIMFHNKLGKDDLKTLATKDTALQDFLNRIANEDTGYQELKWRDSSTGQTRTELMSFQKTPSWGGVTVVAPAVESEIYAPIYKMTGFLIAMGLGAALLLPVLLYFATVKLTGSMKGLTALALRLGNGDLTARADDKLTMGSTQTKNEFSLLARGMNRMAENMETALSAVKRSNLQVQSASGDLVQTSEELTRGAAQESDAASSMASAVEEMHSSISSVGESANHAKEVSRQARALATEGLGAITSATEQMNKISSSVQSTSGVIRQLGEQSREISEIAKIIKDIAEQTNLLALNAAIEAARAGEQGRGFSVVADEVRRLAERTRQSTDDIAGMIEAIQNSSTVAVENMGTAVNSVEKGVELVDRAGHAMHQITDESNAVARSVENIHEALVEQNSASASIGSQVDVVSHLSEANLEMARRAANAVSGLSGVAQELSQILSKFKVADH